MPCCIDRMRFSPRFSIRKKNSFLLFFFLSFFCQVRDLFVSGLVREKSTLESLCMGTLGRHVGRRPAAATSSGGSSAVEQRTVKCASAAILWSGVQISLSGTLLCFCGRETFQAGSLIFFQDFVIRSYHGESTASHQNCEVKHRWVRSVLS